MTRTPYFDEYEARRLNSPSRIPIQYTLNIPTGRTELRYPPSYIYRLVTLTETVPIGNRILQVVTHSRLERSSDEGTSWEVNPYDRGIGMPLDAPVGDEPLLQETIFQTHQNTHQNTQIANLPVF